MPLPLMLERILIGESHESFLFFIFVLLNLILVSTGFNYTSAVTPTIIDAKLKVEVLFKGLKFPTSMEFLGPNDILVTEKNTGTVQRIVNGTLLPKPVLDVNVATRTERGMLGIAISKHDHTNGGPTYVFLYFTESAKKDGNDVSGGQPPLGNRLYRYELVGDKLVNPKLLLDLPVMPGPAHDGGKVAIGPDSNVYVVTGDLEGGDPNGAHLDGRGGILRVTQDGKLVGKGILGSTYPLNLYYAYGIRNSFGIDFDPIAGNLWDTENGPEYGDEINLVKRGFNSGWIEVQGIWEGGKDKPAQVASNPSESIFDFNGNGKYSMPEFTWKRPIGVTAIKFMDSGKLGKQYENGLFVGDFHNGHIYQFELNKDRTKLILKGQSVRQDSRY